MACLLLCTLASPVPAIAEAVLSSDGEWVHDADGRDEDGMTYKEVRSARESTADVDDWSSEWIGGIAVPKVSITSLDAVVPAVQHALYTAAESAIIQLVKVANSMIGYIDDVDSLTADISAKPYKSLYNTVVSFIEDVVEPVAMGFLMLALVLELLQYSKEVNEKNGDVGMWASYMWILVKYGAVAVLVGHTMLVMGAIYSVFLLLAQATAAFFTSSGISMDVYDSLIVNMQETTYANWGVVLVYGLLATVLVVMVVVTVFRVLVLGVTRMFEIFALAAFSGFPLVALVNRSTREGALRYFKSFAGVCLQASVLIFLIMASGLMFSVCTGLIADSSSSSVLVVTFTTVAGPLLGLSAINVMLGKSREISDRIMGA